MKTVVTGEMEHRLFFIIVTAPYHAPHIHSHHKDDQTSATYISSAEAHFLFTLQEFS